MASVRLNSALETPWCRTSIRKTQAAIGEYDELFTLVKKRKLRDNPIGHSEREKKKRQTEEEVGKQYEKVDRNRIAHSARVAENRRRWKGIVANLFVMPRRPSEVMG